MWINLFQYPEAIVYIYYVQAVVIHLEHFISIIERPAYISTQLAICANNRNFHLKSSKIVTQFLDVCTPWLRLLKVAIL